MTFINTFLHLNLLALNIYPINNINRHTRVRNCSNTLYIKNYINSSKTLYLNQNITSKNISYNSSFSTILTNDIEKYNKIILNYSINRYKNIFDNKNKLMEYYTQTFDC